MVQDPEAALYPGMPASAIAHVAIDEAASIDDIARVIVRLVSEQASPNPGPQNPGHHNREAAEQAQAVRCALDNAARTTLMELAEAEEPSGEGLKHGRP